MIALPEEIVCLIADQLPAPALNALTRTCQHFQRILDPLLYSNVIIRNLQKRKAFLLALASCSERYGFVKEIAFDYFKDDENSSECFSDLGLANRLPNLETLHVHSPYEEPDDDIPESEEFIEFKADIRNGKALKRLRKCM